MVKNIFSSFVFTITLSDIDNDKLKEYAYKLKDHNPSEMLSNINGWQSKDLKTNYLDNFNLEISKLLHIIEENVWVFKKELGLRLNLFLSVSNIWININPKAGFNRPHTHPGAILSGVYYVSANKNPAKIVFKNPSVNIEHYCPDLFIENYNEYNSNICGIIPQSGELILFPSWIEHYVEPNINDEDRISIAFNVIISNKKL